MPLTLTFTQAGNYTIDDDGIPGNNTSVIRDANGVVIFTFLHPADALTFRVSTPGVHLTVNFTDSLGAADFTIGNLDPDPLIGPAQTPDSIVMKAVRTTGNVTLVSNGSITEGGADAAADIIAGSLVMSAQTGVGTGANALETQTGLMEAETVTGGINLSNTGSVQIGGLNDFVNGLDVLTSGNLNFTTLGSIFLSEQDLDPGNPPASALQTIHGGNVSGNVTLTANGFSADIIANTNLDAISVPRGSLTLTAGRDIAFGTVGVGFDNDVRANGTVTVNAGRDFLIDGFADLASDDFFQNTGGNVVFNTGRNVHLRNIAGSDASVTASGSVGGDVIITTGFGGALILDAATPTALSSNSGDIIVNADRVLISASSGINAGAGQVILRPATEGRAMILGSVSDAAAAVELSDSELDRVFANLFVIGGTGAGLVRVIGVISPGGTQDITIQSGTNISIESNITTIDALTLRAGDDIYQQAVSTILVNSLSGGTFNAFVDQAGDDEGTGGVGTFAGIVTAPTATLNGNAEADTLRGSGSGETILGNGGNDILRGGGGNDILNGGTGADSMDGGLGDDHFFVDIASDVVIEAVGEGNDRVFSGVTYVLTAGASVETLSTNNNAATTAINLTGNALAQTIVGNAGANTLDSGGGGDTMIGLGGNDFYFVRSSADRAVEAAGAGADRVFAAASFALEANSSVEIVGTNDQTAATAINLTGNNLTQTIVGNAGANTLDSGGGGDVMIGLGGDDFYFVRAAGDRAVESAGAGNDRVFSAVSFTLEAGSSVETLSTTNNAATTAINLTGNALAQVIAGNAGANTLDSGGGGDVMSGLGGDDFYFIRSSADRAVETAGNGNDRVFAAASFALEAGSAVEIIGTIAQGATTAINLTGNALTQTIVGNAGANSLDSGGGGDVMIGLGGNDFYMVRAAGDRAVEAAGAGSDRVFAAVDFTLEAGSAVEILSTIFNAATDAINLTGNALAQAVFGNAGANVLDGKGGLDTLTGFGGADTFAFTSALGAGNVDQVSDFQAGIDRIALENAIFTGLGAGGLPASAFVIGSAAADADDRIIYNNATGALLFDADGNGAGAAVQFATLQGLPAISASDFIVI